MKVRLHGTSEECAAAERLCQVLTVLSVSEAYPDRGMSRLVRVYVEGRLDPDCRDGKHRSCVGAPCDCACHIEIRETGGRR